jgi:hypothetical protein
MTKTSPVSVIEAGSRAKGAGSREKTLVKAPILRHSPRKRLMLRHSRVLLAGMTRLRNAYTRTTSVLSSPGTAQTTMKVGKKAKEKAKGVKEVSITFFRAVEK